MNNMNDITAYAFMDELEKIALVGKIGRGIGGMASRAKASIGSALKRSGKKAISTKAQQAATKVSPSPFAATKVGPGAQQQAATRVRPAPQVPQGAEAGRALGVPSTGPRQPMQTAESLERLKGRISNLKSKGIAVPDEYMAQLKVPVDTNVASREAIMRKIRGTAAPSVAAPGGTAIVPPPTGGGTAVSPRLSPPPTPRGGTAIVPPPTGGGTQIQAPGMQASPGIGGLGIGGLLTAAGLGTGLSLLNRGAPNQGHMQYSQY